MEIRGTESAKVSTGTRPWKLHIPQVIHRKAKNFEFLEKTTASPLSAQNTDSVNIYLVLKSQKSHQAVIKEPNAT